MTHLLAILIFLTPPGPPREAPDSTSHQDRCSRLVRPAFSFSSPQEDPIPCPARHDREDQEETETEAELEDDLDLSSDTIPSARFLVSAHRARDGSHAYILSGQTCGMKLRLVALLRC